MTRRTNQLLALITAPCFILVCAITFEIEISVYRAADIPYQSEIFTGLGVLMAFVLAPFTVSRWTSVRVLKSRSRKTSLFSAPFSSNGHKWIMLYGTMEVVFSLVVGISMYVLLDKALLPAAVLMARAGETLLFLLKNRHLFGIVITPEHVVVAGRGMQIIPIKSVKQAESRFDEVHLITHIGSNKVLPVGNLNPAHQKEFFNVLSDIASTHQIYEHDNLRNLRTSY